MKTITRLFLPLLLTGSTLQAAVSISAPGVTYSENFDLFAGTLASVPANFSYSDSDYTPGGFYTGSAAYNNSNSVYGLRDTPASTDIAFGQKGATGSGDVDTLDWSFVNDTGMALSEFQVSWDVEQYSSGGRGPVVSLQYDANGAGVSTGGIAGANAVTGATSVTAANLTSVQITYRSVTVTLDTPLANGQTIVFGWKIGPGTEAMGSNGHIGVDNLMVTAVPEPSVSLLLFAATGMALRHRRNR